MKLGFSGYGFSLEDDSADIGAGWASQFQVSVGDSQGLDNTNEWTNQAPYGPVSGDGNWDPNQTPAYRYLGFKSASGTKDSPIVITSENHGLHYGEKIIIEDNPTPGINNITWTVGNVTTNTFELQNSVSTGGTFDGGKWARTIPYYQITGFDPINIWGKVMGDDAKAGITGALFSIPTKLDKGVLSSCS